MKVCSKCAVAKPTSDYFVKDRATMRLHAQCKDCYRTHRKTYSKLHYEKYGDDYRARAKARRQKLKKEFRDGILAYLSGKACVICGENDMRTLEFDHIDPKYKLFNISQAVRLGYRWGDVSQELKKCRILCSNCHKKHTSAQFNWYKTL